MPEPSVPGDARAHEISISPAVSLEGLLNNYYKSWQRTLTTDSFEQAQQASSELTAYRQWRRESIMSGFSPFYKLFEMQSAIADASLSVDEENLIKDELLENLTPLGRSFSPRVADLYQALLANVEGSEYQPSFTSTQQQLEILSTSGDLAILSDPQVPWEAKQNRMQTRFLGVLGGWRGLDRRERESALQKTESLTDLPPPASDESKPSMDEMRRHKEGEAVPAIWSINPAYGGYFKQQSFDSWDPKRNIWRQSEYSYTIVQYSSPAPDKDTVALKIECNLPAGQWVRIPIPYTHEYVNSNNLFPDHTHADPALDDSYVVQKDQNGDYVILSRKDKPFSINLALYEETSDQSHQNDSTQTAIPGFNAQFTEETHTAIKNISQRKKTTIDKARALASYTMRRLKYSNDSSYNLLYDNHANGYIAGIDEMRAADCDVANTYFAALCAELGIPARHVVGHMVKGKDSQGNSRITSGTGHAWTEVWDEVENTWVRIDATPPGDPQLEVGDQKTESVPGDYGGQEAIGPTDEELAELEKRLSEVKEQLSYTSQERELAEAAGVQLGEARKIVKEIQKTENIRLPGGERVVDVMSGLFNLIVESRKTKTAVYTGPLKKREGGQEIENVVAHYIGIKAGEADPRSRRKQDDRQSIADVFSGLDVYIIGDKSASMHQTVDGETKWRMQQRAQYLVLSSLHRFEQDLKRSAVALADPLSVRTQVISFRDGVSIDEDKPLSGEFTLKDKVRLWQSLGNIGSGNGDVAALTVIKNQVEEEISETESSGKKDTRLRIIIACSDGDPDSESGVRQLAQELGQHNAVVVGVGLTETAAKVPIFFDTPYSHGVVVGDINNLPEVVGREIVSEAIRLFPERGREFAQKQIDTMLSKFPSV